MLLAMLALLCVPVGAEVEGEETVAGGVEGETVAGKLEDVASDVYNTIKTSDAPLPVLQKRYGLAAKKACVGTCAGFVAGRAVQSLALNIFKVGSAAFVGVVIAAALGWIGKDPTELLNKYSQSAVDQANVLYRMSDLNGDGQINEQDLKLWWRRTEKVILKGNLAITLGLVWGAALSFVL